VTERHPLSALRPRERQIVALLLAHYRVPQIAERLGISPHTVRNHLKGAFRRTGTHCQSDLLRSLSGAAGMAGAAISRGAGTADYSLASAPHREAERT
jgi:DNA-binding CsgD family transcriptional regulator